MPMNAVVLDEGGKARTLLMGCYGIGVTRVVAAAIEQNHDDKGIVWPTAIAPYQVALLPMNMHKSERLRHAVEALYQALEAAGVEVLLDDRAIRPGVMFADADLIGIPHQVVFGERGLDAGRIEYRRRGSTRSEELPLDDAATRLASDECQGVIVVHGDPMDPDLLRSEGVENVDDILALTKWDEVNVVASLVEPDCHQARTAGAHRIHRSVGERLVVRDPGPAESISRRPHRCPNAPALAQAVDLRFVPSDGDQARIVASVHNQSVAEGKIQVELAMTIGGKTAMVPSTRSVPMPGPRSTT